MKCKYGRLLNKYLDNELTARNHDFMDKHLKGCLVCGSALKFAVLFREYFAKNKIDSNAEFFWQQLKGRIAESQAPDESGDFLLDFGNWAKKLVPVPMAIGVIAAIFICSSPITKENLIDSYLFNGSASSAYSLSEEEPGIHSGFSALFY